MMMPMHSDTSCGARYVNPALPSSSCRRSWCLGISNLVGTFSCEMPISFSAAVSASVRPDLTMNTAPRAFHATHVEPYTLMLTLPSSACDVSVSDSRWRQ